jgi:hypothetical protein
VHPDRAKPAYQPSPEQLDAMENFIRSMDLMTAGRSADGWVTQLGVPACKH